MIRKSHKSPMRSMPWLVIIAAIVILILISLTATLVIQRLWDYSDRIGST